MRITANMVTMTRIVLMPIPGYLLYGESRALMAALVATVILGLTDWVDGIMARKEGPSVLGGLLDPIADKIFIAVIYLPLTERGVIPAWMTACIFCRDFIVTALRTSLSLRDAPMRTSLIAKYKTAIQMVGIGYVILFQAFADTPRSIYVWLAISVPMALPLGLILYRAITGQKQGPRSRTMLALMIFAFALWAILGPEMSTIIYLYIITALTVYSGLSYLIDAWSAIKGTPGSYKEFLRFLLEGFLVPIAFVLLLGKYDAVNMSLFIILVITIELAMGGLGNLLAEHKVAPKFRWTALKSTLQLLCATVALSIAYLNIQFEFPMGETAIALAFLVTLLSGIFSYIRHREVYLRVL